MTLEKSIKDAIAKKLEDGTVEKLIEEQVEKGVNNALNSLFGSYGDVTKVIEEQVKSVMIPYLERFDYSQYIVKLDSVMVDVLKGAALENKILLQNFKNLMLPEERETIKASELFAAWKDYVAKNVETNGLEVCFDGGPAYEDVDIRMDVSCDDDRGWGSFRYATLTLDCEHDEEMNFAIRLSHYTGNKSDEWTFTYDTGKDIRSLRYLNDFEILLMRLDRAGVKLIMDTSYERDEITPEKEPELTYG
ncbi:MAG: phage protein [Anaerosporomusa subterranea]|jgi:hypothetical protein|nr:phage protein [Anaerosporomusa subterranea]